MLAVGSSSTSTSSPPCSSSAEAAFRVFTIAANVFSSWFERGTPNAIFSSAIMRRRRGVVE